MFNALVLESRDFPPIWDAALLSDDAVPIFDNQTYESILKPASQTQHAVLDGLHNSSG